MSLVYVVLDVLGIIKVHPINVLFLFPDQIVEPLDRIGAFPFFRVSQVHLDFVRVQPIDVASVIGSPDTGKPPT